MGFIDHQRVHMCIHKTVSLCEELSLKTEMYSHYITKEPHLRWEHIAPHGPL